MALTRTIQVTVVFEPSRSGDQALAQAYQCAVPVVRRPVPPRLSAESQDRPDTLQAVPARIARQRG